MKNFYSAIIVLLISCGSSKDILDQDNYFMRRSQINSYIFIFNQSGKGEIYDWGGSFRSKTFFDWIEIDKGFILFHKFDHEDEQIFSIDTLVLNGRFLQIRNSQEEDIPKSKLTILPLDLKIKQISQEKFNRKYREFVNHF
jgi:hypothetical protein